MKSQATRNTVLEARRQRAWTILTTPFAIAGALLFAFALVSMITPAQAADDVEAYRVARDTFYCPDAQITMAAKARIMAEDYPGYLSTVRAGNCGKAPKGFVVVVTDVQGDTTRGLMRNVNDQVIDGYFMTPMLTPAPDLMPAQAATVLTKTVFMCRQAIAAELYQSRLDAGDSLGAKMLIQENGCAPVFAGDMITVTGEPNDRVYAVEAPVGGQVVPGFIPQAQIR
jgi:hypothetical protein